MIHYRSFRNSDPPAVAAIWRAQRPSNALMQPMTAGLLDELVFSKPYFCREGLILAIDNGTPVGFVHAGFGPNEDRSGLEPHSGATSLLLVSSHEQHDAIARELLARSEQFLCDRGARMLYGGGTETLAPFYLGFYGGSRLPGVLASDSATADLFRTSGYTETNFGRIFRRDLAGFRPPVDRHLIQVRRKHQFAQTADSLPQDWWEASLFSQIDRLRFELSPPLGGKPVAWACFWDIEPLASSWGVHAMGLLDLEMPRDAPDVATFFVGEMLRQLQSYGTTLVEIQAGVEEQAVADVCRRLGFDETDQGLLFRKLVRA
jgi:hypothetical protein